MRMPIPVCPASNVAIPIVPEESSLLEPMGRLYGSTPARFAVSDLRRSMSSDRLPITLIAGGHGPKPHCWNLPHKAPNPPLTAIDEGNQESPGWRLPRAELVDRPQERVRLRAFVPKGVQGRDPPLGPAELGLPMDDRAVASAESAALSPEKCRRGCRYSRVDRAVASAVWTGLWPMPCRGAVGTLGSTGLSTLRCRRSCCRCRVPGRRGCRQCRVAGQGCRQCWPVLGFDAWGLQ